MTSMPSGQQESVDDAEATWRSLLWMADVLADRFRAELAASAAPPEQDAATRYGLDAYADADAYRAWLDEIHRTLAMSRGDADQTGQGPHPMTVSVIIARPGAEPARLQRCVESVRNQVHPGWELFLCDDGSGDEEVRAYLGALAGADRRVTVLWADTGGATPGACNVALGMASGELVTLVDPGGELTPDALAALVLRAEEEPGAEVIYTDEDQLTEDGLARHPHFKPDWSPDLLLSSPYLGHLTAVRRQHLVEIGGFHADDDVDRDYDLMLRATEKARNVAHIGRVLYRSTGGGRPGDDVLAGLARHEAGRRALVDALARREIAGHVESGLVAGTFRTRRLVRHHPSVSVIIPFRDQAPMLRACVDSLGPGTGHGEVELVLVDNGSMEPETKAVKELLSRRAEVRLLEHPGPFNWSAINNAAAATCQGDMLLFLNNDIVASGSEWLTGLVEQAQRPEVGAVGCRLLYPDGTVQHAGVVLGMHVLAGHVMCGLPGDDPGYLGWAKVVRNASAVSAACMMCRRTVFDELGGFDERYGVAFNDVDFCLRLRRAGYSIVYTPYAELVHHESRTRGMSGFYGDYQAFLGTWVDEVRRGDPFYSANLSRLDLRCKLRPTDEDRRWEMLLSRLTASSDA